MESLILTGTHIRLEPLNISYAEGMASASAADPSLYQWSHVPQGKYESMGYIEAALAQRDAGTAVPFAIVRIEDGVLLGSTRFWNIEYWPWPQGHARHGRSSPDACEIGYTWLTRASIRTATNTEAKRLMLTHAFESWGVLRVCLHTDVRNLQSRAAMERIGARFEGILRSHRMAADFIARDSARYSIIEAEWPDVKRRLAQLQRETSPKVPKY